MNHDRVESFQPSPIATLDAWLASRVQGGLPESRAQNLAVNSDLIRNKILPDVEIIGDSNAKTTMEKHVPWGQGDENGVGVSGPGHQTVHFHLEESSQRHEPYHLKKIVAWGQVGIGPTGEEVAISGPPSSKAKSSSHEELDIEALRRLLK